MPDRRQEELNFGKQMDNAFDKKRIVKLVVDGKCKNVVDLGAGTGMIARQISEFGIKVSAVDLNFKADGIKNTPLLTYYPCDLVRFVYNIDEKFDCIILSAVLHELSREDFSLLAKGLKKIADPDGCMIIIREPYFERMPDGRIRPFKTKELQEIIPKIIGISTPDRNREEFLDTPKKSEISVPNCIKYLNMAFTYSYGADSWYREVKENRYAFSKKVLVSFCKKVLGSDGITFQYEFFDKEYKTYFRECGYADRILDSIEYTNCLIVAKSDGMSA